MRRLTTLATLALAPLFGPCNAQAADSTEQILVTAARTPIPLSAAGAGVTVITRQDIEERQATFVSDLLRDVPGFSVASNGGPGQFTQIRVRGAEANQLQVLIDGVKANDMTRDDSFDFAHLLTNDIERIEIVRGPQSALWGSEALAGVINIITRHGSEKPTAVVGVEAGSFGTVSTSATLGGSRNGVDGMLGVSHYQTNGTSVARHGSEPDGYDNTTVNMRLGWKPIETLKFDVSGRYLTAGVDTDADLGLGIPSDTRGHTDIKQSYSQARGVLETFGGHWVHQVTGMWSYMHNRDFDPDAFIDDKVLGDRIKAGYQSSVNFETRPLLPLAHVLTFAFDWERQTFRQRAPVSLFGDPNQDRELQVRSYAGEYRASVATHTTFSVSGRWDDNDAFKSIGTWRVAFSHLFPQTGTTFSAAYGTGQKSPTFYDRFGYSPGGGFAPTFVGNSALRPSESRGYEIGLQQSLFKDRLKLALTWFDERLTHEIKGYVTSADGLTATALNLPGTSPRKGVELSAMARLMPHWTAQASYTYLDASQPNPATGLFQPEIRRAPHQVAASTTWTPYGGKFSFNVHLNYTSEREDDSFLPPLYTSSRVTLKPYTLLGLTGQWRMTSALTLEARLENVLNERYEDVFGFQTPGFAGYAGVRYQFGE